MLSAFDSSGGSFDPRTIRSVPRPGASASGRELRRSGTQSAKRCRRTVPRSAISLTTSEQTPLAVARGGARARSPLRSRRRLQPVAPGRTASMSSSSPNRVALAKQRLELAGGLAGRRCSSPGRQGRCAWASTNQRRAPAIIDVAGPGIVALLGGLRAPRNALRTRRPSDGASRSDSAASEISPRRPTRAISTRSTAAAVQRSAAAASNSAGCSGSDAPPPQPATRMQTSAASAAVRSGRGRRHGRQADAARRPEPSRSFSRSRPCARSGSGPVRRSPAGP